MAHKQGEHDRGEKRIRTLNGDSIFLPPIDQPINPTFFQSPLFDKQLKTHGELRRAEAHFRAILLKRLKRFLDSYALWILGEIPNSAIRNAANEFVQLGMDDVFRIVRDAITRSAERERAAILAFLNARTLLLGGDKMFVESAVEQTLSAPYPDTEISALRRMALTRLRLMRVVDAALAARDEPDVTFAKLHHTLFGTSATSNFSRTPLSIHKSLARLQRSEAQRANHLVANRIFKTANVTFAYWRLSPLHPNYGGDEICDRLADATGEGVLDALGDKVFSTDVRGLYLTTAYPDTPHPHCLCYAEPLIT